MAKKVLLVLALVSMLAGGVWAQDAAWGGKKNFVSVDLGLLEGGVRYERFLSSKLSVGVDFYWNSLFFFWNELEAGAFARYYLMGGFFGELGLGFHQHTGTDDGWLITSSGVGISPGIGWKFDPGNAGGFFVEPGISIPITIGKKNQWLYGEENKVGVSVGVVVYVGLGWAF
jgi:hypothetical protein